MAAAGSSGGGASARQLTNATSSCVDTSADCAQRWAGKDCWTYARAWWTPYDFQKEVEERLSSCPESCNACYGQWSGPWDQEEQYFYELHEYESSDCRASSLFQTTYLRIGYCVDGRRGSLAVRRDGLVDWYAAPYCEGAPALADDPFFYDAVDGCVQSTALSWSNRVFGGAPDVYVRSSMAVLPRASVDASRLVGIEEWWPIPRLPGTRVYDYTAWSLGCDALPALYRAYEPRVCYKVFSALPGWMTNLYAPPDLWRAFECEGDELAERYFLDGACAGDPFRWDELNESTHDLLT